MITSRRIHEIDRPSIDSALGRDAFHVGTKSDTFYQEGVVTNVYEDDDGPIFILRAQKALRIEMLFFDNGAKARNATAMLEGWKQLLHMASVNGFKEIVTSTNSSKLRDFAVNMLGMQETNVGGEIELKIAIGA